MTAASARYTPRELVLASGGALLIQAVAAALLAGLGANAASVPRQEALPPLPSSIAVKPMLDDLPLLKLGGKKRRPKLPDLWEKPPPPVKQVEARSAPSPDAAKTPDAIPTSSVALGDAAAPPPDAEIVAKADEDLAQVDAAPPDAADIEGPGAAGGVKDGTETDPLKARAVSQYQLKILSWFNARFKRPDGELPCEELKTLSAAVSVSVGGDRSVAGYSIVRPSGNAVFDARVRSTMDSIVGQQLPPPPPLYPDILGGTVSPVFSGAGAKCAATSPPDGPAPRPGGAPAPPAPDEGAHD